MFKSVKATRDVTLFGKSLTDVVYMLTISMLSTLKMKAYKTCKIEILEQQFSFLLLLLIIDVTSACSC